MISYFKADCYRIVKERLGLVTVVLLLVLAGVIAYAFREAPVLTVSGTLVSLLSSFLPLFFVTPGKIFFGEDFVQRTINNSLVKAQNRSQLFFYRWGMSVLTSLALVLLTYLTCALAYHLFSGEVAYLPLLTSFIHQVPYYLFLAALPLVFFNIFDKIYMTNTLYIVYIMMFESLTNLVCGVLLKIDSKYYIPYFFVKKLSETTGSDQFINQSSLSAMILMVGFLLLTYNLFAHREFK